jgi:hypothetical protein
LVSGLEIKDGTIYMRVMCNNQGATASPFVILAGLLGIDIDPTKTDDIARRFLVAKIAIEW